MKTDTKVGQENDVELEVKTPDSELLPSEVKKPRYHGKPLPPPHSKPPIVSGYGRWRKRTLKLIHDPRSAFTYQTPLKVHRFLKSSKGSLPPQRAIAAKLKVSLKVLEKWLKVSVELRGVLDYHYDMQNNQVEKALYKRAVGFSQEEEKIFQHQGTPIKVKHEVHYAPDVVAADKWLSRRDKANWGKDAIEVEAVKVPAINVTLNFGGQQKELTVTPGPKTIDVTPEDK